MSRRKRMMQNLEEDIRDFIERETQDNIERGMPPEEARYAARRKFGNVTRVKEDTWEVWSLGWLEQLGRTFATACGRSRRTAGSRPSPQSQWHSALRPPPWCSAS
ncbi:MAG TPA: permease prefix domain 1-containing protein [Terriglobia bacterium]|nr:permease prefix domain 1-containing protein [Terriglobia bacterium]